jgi:hypothetical protein
MTNFGMTCFALLVCLCAYAILMLDDPTVATVAWAAAVIIFMVEFICAWARGDFKD